MKSDTNAKKKKKFVESKLAHFKSIFLTYGGGASPIRKFCYNDFLKIKKKMFAHCEGIEVIKIIELTSRENYQRNET